jgi:hypothetical protein
VASSHPSEFLPARRHADRLGSLGAVTARLHASLATPTEVLPAPSAAASEVDRAIPALLETEA